MPRFMCESEDYYDKDKWIDTPFIKTGDIKEKFKNVCDGLDELLVRHGYVHNGKIFNVEEVYFLDFFINSKKVSKIK